MKKFLLVVITGFIVFMPVLPMISVITEALTAASIIANVCAGIYSIGLLFWIIGGFYVIKEFITQ